MRSIWDCVFRAVVMLTIVGYAILMLLQIIIG